MEGTEMESEDIALRSQLHRRCAQSAMILYSLKSSRNRRFITSSNDQDEDKELMIKEIRDLKVKLARERVKSKRIELCGLMEVILQVITVLSCFTVVLMLAFESTLNRSFFCAYF